MTAAATAPTGLAGMHPAYFALVMATGIVSLACELLGLHPLAVALFALNLGCYPLLWILSCARVIRHRDRVRADLVHHGRAVGFFTTVAATCVLGSQCLVIGGSPTAALGLWIAGIVLWAGLVYPVFALLTVKPDKPPLADGINGGWLISVVAAQSVAVLGAQLAPQLGEIGVVFALAMWLGGGMLYLWIISLIFYRYGGARSDGLIVKNVYWINMGAAAISTLAGAMLVGAAPYAPVVGEILPFVRGLTLMWWATATWWIPMLVILGVWRHVVRRFPLRYDPLYWGAVFPLGMYTVCTVRLSHAVQASFLIAIPRVFVFVALAGWAITAIGMLWHLVSCRTRRRAPPGSPTKPE